MVYRESSAIRIIHLLIVVVVWWLIVSMAGCGSAGPVNPSFPLAAREATNYLKDLRQEPITLKRPLIVLAGYQDPGFGASGVARRIERSVTNPSQIVVIHFFTSPTFDAARRRVLETVQGVFPSNDPEWTIEVDVVGISMGGIVARHAARKHEEDDAPRLRINRLFSIGSPHTGAALADLPTFDQKQVDMRLGSDFLQELNDDPTSSDFVIIPYVRLGDAIVGAEHAAPPGETVWWLPNLPFQFAHLTSASDPRILADILARLGGDESFTIGTPLPPPGEDGKFSRESIRRMTADQTE